MRKFLRGVASVVAVAVLGVMGMVSYYSYALPDSYRIFAGSPLSPGGFGVTASAAGEDVAAVESLSESDKIELSLLGVIPIKQAKVTRLEETTLIPCGTPFGVKLLAEGVVVIGLTAISTTDGGKYPARDAGIEIGDIILSIDGARVSTNEQVGQMVADSNGKPLKIRFRRDGKEKEETITPVKAEPAGQWRAGLWVRDSSAGIGTVTFCTGSGVFGGLGHPICDVDTGEIMPLGSGEIVSATINGVQKGTSGTPGELKGVFDSDGQLGVVKKNTDCGLYGVLDQPLTAHDPVKLGLKQEVHTGSASIYTTLEGQQPQEYQVEIVQVDQNAATRNLVVKVTDSKLLEQTGGIVQGMSGSPIIQDGKLVGAVTHVFVNDPTKGYGIFAETMLEQAEDLEPQALQKAS